MPLPKKLHGYKVKKDSRVGNQNTNRGALKDSLLDNQRRVSGKRHKEWKTFVGERDFHLGLFRKKTRKLILKKGFKKIPIFARDITRKQYNIMEALRKAGLPIERFFVKPEIGQRGTAYFIDSGKTLQKIMWSIPRSFGRKKSLQNIEKMKAVFFGDMPKIVAKMHLMGVKHGHLHSNNIVYDGKQLTIIDFSLVEDKNSRIFVQTSKGLKGVSKPVKLNSGFDAYKLFSDDYFAISDTLEKLWFTREEKKQFFSILYDNFNFPKASIEDKKEFIGLIVGG